MKQVYAGPFDREKWPEKLSAHVVEPGPFPRIHGYRVDHKLASCLSQAELLFLSFKGELPTSAQKDALNAAGALLAPIHVGQAPSHAAVLSRLGGSTPAASVAIAAVGLGELAREEIGNLETRFAWLLLGGDEPRLTTQACGALLDPDFQKWIQASIKQWFGSEARTSTMSLDRVTGGYTILFHLGFREEMELTAITVCFRLPAAAAEAAQVKIGSVMQYPARLPDYQYQDERGKSL